MKKTTPECKHISQLWKVGRLLIGKTQVELSKELGISQSSISKYESQALELGYIDGCTKFKVKLHRTSAFKLPLKYRGDFALKVREIIPFKECVVKDLGQTGWEKFLDEVNIVPELFFIYDFQLSLRFIFDLADWYQQKTNANLFEMVEKHFAHLENHGEFGKQYLKQKTANDLLSNVLDNQPYYQRAFTTETSQTAKGLSVKLVVEPEMNDVFGEVKTRQYLLHKINAFQAILNQNTSFKGDFEIAPRGFEFSLESTG